MPAKTMNHPAQRKLPLKAETMAQNPKKRLPRVNALGMTTTTWRIVRRRTPSRPLHQLHSATTVTPARVVSPALTSVRVPTGRKRSTREPKRIMPMRSPWRTGVPTSMVGHDAAGDQPGDLADQHLAAAPRASPTDDCSLSRLDFSAAAWPNLPAL